MATGDDPVAASSEQVTTSASGMPPAGTGGEHRITDSERIPLPPLEQPTEKVPESFLRRVRFLDAVLVLLLLGFAFVCASFRAWNSDLFLNLAVGRLIAQGNYVFGADPFSFASQGTWVNHAWLFGLGCYLVYSLGAFGGALLVVLKAVVVVLTAWLMLQSGSRKSQSIWIPMALTGLAVLAMSPRLLLQPTVLSMMLLAYTMYLLSQAEEYPRRLWRLPVVCLLWVNLDSWFVLGPATILLYFAGEVFENTQRTAAERQKAADPRTLGLVLLASLAACLVNPYHVWAFTTLPVGLLQTGSMAEYKAEGIFRGLFISPFEQLYFSPYFGLSAGGLAYFVLLGLGLISFGLIIIRQLEKLSWWRLLIWLAMALLSGWNYRTIPFFAVVAAPITAQNFLDFARGLGGSSVEFDHGTRRWAVTGRVFTALLALGLIVASLPGWLQAQPYYRRTFGFGIEEDLGLRHACEQIAQWRQQGKLGTEQRWFNLSPESMNYMAWFAPGEKCFLDARLELFPGMAREFSAIRRALSGEDRPSESGGEPPPPAWRKIFVDRGIAFMLFHSADLLRSSQHMAMLQRLYSNPDEFVPCFVEGTAAVFAWQDPRPGKANALDQAIKLDFNREAFGEKAVRAPEQGVRAESTPVWWKVLLAGETATPMQSLSALQQVTRFDNMNFPYGIVNDQVFLGAMAASQLGIAGAPTGPLGGGLLLPLRMYLTYFGRGGRTVIDALAMDRRETVWRTMDQGPVASLYLAIRLARQGLVENPEDVFAQLFLAEGYSRLAYKTRERSRVSFYSGGREVQFFPHVQAIRQAQITAALQNLLRVSVRPEQERAAHQLLVEVFREPEYFEVYLKHFKEFAKLAAKLPPQTGMTLSQFREQLKNLEGRVKELEKEMKNRRDRYEVSSANKPLLEKVQIARSLGLAETALNLLLRADPKDLRNPQNPQEAPGVTLVVHLLLGLGRLDEVRQALEGDPNSETGVDKRSFGLHPLGMPAYQWFQIVLGAATGDYESADKNLQECLEESLLSQSYNAMLARLDLVDPSWMQKQGSAQLFAGLLVGSALLQEAPQAAGMPWQILKHVPIRLYPPHAYKQDPGTMTLLRGVEFLQSTLELQADLWTLRGWLALEAGQIEKAQEFTRKAIALADLEIGPEKEKRFLFFRSRPLANLVLELAENRLTRN